MVSTAPVIWIEISDLVEYSRHRDQPTGIQRVVQEILAAAQKSGRSDVRVCRIHLRTGEMEAMTFDEAHGLIRRTKREGIAYRRFGRRYRRFGVIARDILRRAPAACADRDGRARWRAAFEEQAQAGDVILSLGASWDDPHFGPRLAAIRARKSLRFVQLLHDIIPISHRGVTNEDFVAHFARWLNETARQADLQLVPSRHVAAEIGAYAQAHGWAQRPIEPLRFGSGFNALTAGAAASPLREPFALCVGTLDIRKNIDLLISVWERLVRVHGPGRVPVLALAGHRGHGSVEILARLQRLNYLDGRIRFFERIGDAELEALYRDALFMLVPSRAEGWGLPVAEALCHGKAVICSNATSLPEVGGDLVDYFHPDDADAALALVEKAMFDEDWRTARTDRVRREFKPRSWDACFEELVGLVHARFPARDLV